MPTWTKESVLAKVRELGYIDLEEEWRKAYVVPIAEFGIKLHQGFRCSTRFDYDEGEHESELIPLDKVKWSTQGEGVRLDAIAHYLQSEELFDEDGWFGNDIPVVHLRRDKTYTVRDGNHRILAALLRGDTHIRAYVQRGTSS